MRCTMYNVHFHNQFGKSADGSFLLTVLCQIFVRVLCIILSNDIILENELMKHSLQHMFSLKTKQSRETLNLLVCFCIFKIMFIG